MHEAAAGSVLIRNKNHTIQCTVMYSTDSSGPAEPWRCINSYSNSRRRAASTTVKHGHSPSSRARTSLSTNSVLAHEQSHYYTLPSRDCGGGGAGLSSAVRTAEQRQKRDIIHPRPQHLPADDADADGGPLASLPLQSASLHTIYSLLPTAPYTPYYYVQRRHHSPSSGHTTVGTGPTEA